MVASFHKSLLALFAVIATAISICAQSSDQSFPTPVRSNEINGQIKARDIGDPRLTRFFYVFDGGQGDIFVNVLTKNFAGDIDVFTAETLKPMTKMVIYPDGSSINETGRLIYLRKGERLLLRVEGRTPNDDPAMFRIKFGGSFMAITGGKEEDAPTVEKTESDSGIRVNSVGTIVEVIPKKKVEKTPVEIPPSVPVKTAAARNEVKTPERSKTEPASEDKPEPSKPVVVVTEPPQVSTVFNSRPKPTAENKTPVKAKAAGTKTTAARPTGSKAKPAAPPAEPAVDPLANVRLVVQLKTGDVIERPMNEVLRFAWDKGILVVVTKDGKISRYSIFDVAKVTIE